MRLRRSKTLKWEGREVLEGSGRVSELRQEIAYFTTTPFRIEGEGVNELYCHRKLGPLPKPRL